MHKKIKNTMKHLDLKLSAWEVALNKAINLNWIDKLMDTIKGYNDSQGGSIIKKDQRELRQSLTNLLEFCKMLKVAIHMWKNKYPHILMETIIVNKPAWVTNDIYLLTFQVIITSTDHSPEGTITALPHLTNLVANPTHIPNFFHENILYSWIRANQMFLEESFYNNASTLYFSWLEKEIHFPKETLFEDQKNFTSLIDLLLFIVQFNQITKVKANAFILLLLIIQYIKEQNPKAIPRILTSTNDLFPTCVDKLTQAVLTDPFVIEGSDCLYRYLKLLSKNHWIEWIKVRGNDILTTIIKVFSIMNEEEEDSPLSIFLWAFLKTLYFESWKFLPHTGEFYHACLNLYPTLASFAQHHHTISRVDPTAASHFTPLLRHMHDQQHGVQSIVH